jgi:hypothetical protein
VAGNRVLGYEIHVRLRSVRGSPTCLP